MKPTITVKINEANPDPNVGRKIFQKDLSMRLIKSLQNISRYEVMLRGLSIDDTQNIISLNVSIKEDDKYIESENLGTISGIFGTYPQLSFPFIDVALAPFMQIMAARKSVFGMQSSLGLASLSIAAASLLMSLIFFVLIFAYRKATSVKLSDPRISMVMLLGIALVQSRVFFSFDKPDLTKCALKISSVALGLGLFLG
jgi:hypothetical protein